MTRGDAVPGLLSPSVDVVGRAGDELNLVRGTGAARDQEVEAEPDH